MDVIDIFFIQKVTTIDRQVAKLYEEGARKPRSSDSSRRTRFSNRRSAAGAGMKTSIYYVIFSKAFSKNVIENNFGF